jgi:beta-galactosidase
LTELIKQNYNHPSIFFWSLENELIPDRDPAFYGSVVEELNSLAKELDPTRLTTVASRGNYSGDIRMNSITDVIGYNVYKGWYEGTPEGFAAYADTYHAKYPKQCFAISEYGAGAGTNQHEYPARKHETTGPWHPEEWQATLHEVIWKAIAERPYLWGTFVWNMFDFASDGRSEGELPGRNDKGLVTYDRKVKKDAFYWYKANWTSNPMVYIASRRFARRPVNVTDIKVYSNCDSVEVSLNGKSKGSKMSGDRIFRWPGLGLIAGKNKIKAVGMKDGKRAEDTCTWEYAPKTEPAEEHDR